MYISSWTPSLCKPVLKSELYQCVCIRGEKTTTWDCNEHTRIKTYSHFVSFLFIFLYFANISLFLLQIYKMRDPKNSRDLYEYEKTFYNK